MKLLVFAVFDAAAEAFLAPIFFDTKGQAVRVFADACNDAEHQFRRHADDYTLFHIGFYEPSSGELSALPTPDSMGVALQYIERPHSENAFLRDQEEAVS